MTWIGASRFALISCSIILNTLSRTISMKVQVLVIVALPMLAVVSPTNRLWQRIQRQHNLASLQSSLLRSHLGLPKLSTFEGLCCDVNCIMNECTKQSHHKAFLNLPAFTLLVCIGEGGNVCGGVFGYCNSSAHKP